MALEVNLHHCHLHYNQLVRLCSAAVLLSRSPCSTWSQRVCCSSVCVVYACLGLPVEAVRQLTWDPASTACGTLDAIMRHALKLWTQELLLLRCLAVERATLSH